VTKFSGRPATASRKPSLARRERPKIVHTSVYLPAAIHEALREAGVWPRGRGAKSSEIWCRAEV